MNGARICFSCKAEAICKGDTKAYSEECRNNMLLFMKNKKKFNEMKNKGKERAAAGK